MIFESTQVAGAYLVQVEPVEDERGFFARSFCRREFQEHGLNPDVEHCNISHNRLAGTLRGLHAQRKPHQEAKLVRCTRGVLFDVVLDLRPDSPTWLRHDGFRLTADNRHMLYAPEGVYHGFLTLEDDTEVVYQISQYYVPEAGTGVRWNDPAFGIRWPGEVKVISARDAGYPDFDPAEFGR
jgi:dTDP-4-dehydrorhamnose 3,5-epimerase